MQINIIWYFIDSIPWFFVGGIAIATASAGVASPDCSFSIWIATVSCVRIATTLFSLTTKFNASPSMSLHETIWQKFQKKTKNKNNPHTYVMHSPQKTDNHTNN